MSVKQQILTHVNDNGMKNKGGRKSYFEELNIANRYALLSEDYFKFLKEMMASEELADRKWAAERLEKAYVKMIPQDITSGGAPLTITFDTAFTKDENND
jgi:hypothetical protein